MPGTSPTDVQRLRARLDDELSAGRTDLAVARVEFDRFERIRDWHGEAVSEAVHAALTERLLDACRDEELLARESESQHLVVLPAPDDSQEALADIAWHLMDQLTAPIEGVADEAISVGATVGIAHPGTLGTPETANLVNAAVVASHRASIYGSRRIAVFEDLSGLFSHVSELDRSLTGALEEGHIGPWFQPQVRLSDGRIVAAEALARWDHETLGVVSPGAFVPEAEWSGVIQDVDLAIIEQAGRYASTWPDDLHVSMNISAANLDNPRLAQRVLSALERSGLHPQRAVVEVTETALAQNRGAAMLTLAEFRAWGITVSLDDFGAGHAFFDALREGLFDEVKIDRSLVATESADAQAFLAAVVTLARSVGAKAVAEGIETPGELQRAIDAGCDVAQGFLFARPMPPEVFIDFLDTGLTVDLAALLGGEG